MAEKLHVFLIAGEESGDRLGASLMAALRARHGADVRFSGIGGAHMAGEGLSSLFPSRELALVGFTAVIARLPSLVRRLRQAVDAVVAGEPDVLVIIDSPDFTQRVAARVRDRAPEVSIVNWISPTVWAWRPGRARKMASYVDHLLAILPFEPEVHRELGGPPCTYVGHPILSQLESLTPSPGERPELDDADAPHLVVLPGSRHSEIRRLMPVFGETLGQIAERMPTVRATLPAVPALEADIRARIEYWRVKPEIVVGEEAKKAAFRSAHAALAASGTVTLELALARVPMVVAYKVDPLFRLLGPYLVKTWTIVLPNFIVDRPMIREYLMTMVRPEPLARATEALLTDTPERRAQLESMRELADLMSAGDQPPAVRAAEIVEDVARRYRP